VGRIAAHVLHELLELRLGAVRGRRARSVYFGGGTPSLWAPACVEQVLEILRGAFEMEPQAEITLEANPGAADAARFDAFRRAGVNRLSIGIQSFDASSLRALGRVHDPTQAEQALSAAREAGFENLSLDLIYGAPGQTLSMARADAERAASLGPEHISCYGLTLEHLAVEVPMAVRVRDGGLQVPDEEAQAEMGEAVREVLRRAGYVRYEVSNYARDGLQSRHNLLYWTGGEYLGLGAGASGFALQETAEPFRGGRRWSNVRSAARYLERVEAGKLPEESSETLDSQTLLRERVAMGLRLVEGLDLGEACRVLQHEPGPWRERAESLVAQGLARLVGERLALTEWGLDFHTEAAMRFF